MLFVKQAFPYFVYVSFFRRSAQTVYAYVRVRERVYVFSLSLSLSLSPPFDRHLSDPLRQKRAHPSPSRKKGKKKKKKKERKRRRGRGKKKYRFPRVAISEITIDRLYRHRDDPRFDTILRDA